MTFDGIPLHEIFLPKYVSPYLLVFWATVGMFFGVLGYAGLDWAENAWVTRKTPASPISKPTPLPVITAKDIQNALAKYQQITDKAKKKPIRKRKK